MFERLKKLLNSEEESAEEDSQSLDHIISDLKEGLKTINLQIDNISQQEKEISKSLRNFKIKQTEKYQSAKNAFRKNQDEEATEYFNEGESLNTQIQQYQLILNNIRETGKKLTAQKNQLQLTKDQVESRKMMGVASLGASQTNADVTEQLMILEETGELAKFDALIKEADEKTQAISKIQSIDDEINFYLTDSKTNIDKIEDLVKQDDDSKLQQAHNNQQVLIERVFGKTVQHKDHSHKQKQNELLNRLKHENHSEEKEDRIDNFFNSFKDEKGEGSNPQNHVNDQEDRIRNFFK